MLNPQKRRKPGWQYVFSNLEERRAVFPPSFSEEEVPKDCIQLILKAANWAPTHKLTQPWRFVVIRGDSRKKLARHLLTHYELSTAPELQLEKKRAKILSNPVKASAVIAICLHVDQEQIVPEWEELAATACAVQNLWLAATALGIGGYWSSPAAVDHLGSFLCLRENEKCLGLFYLGYHLLPPSKPKRTPWEEKVKWME